MSAPQVSFVYTAVADLKPAKRNPRTHSDKQIRQIAALRRRGCSDWQGSQLSASIT